jgi:hypothetical protein
MFPAIMPWPMTLAPMNEAIRCDICVEKNFYKDKITVMIRVIMQDVRIVLLSKKSKIL